MTSPLPANNPSYKNSLFPNAVDSLHNQPDPETADAIMAMQSALIGGLTGGAPGAPAMGPMQVNGPLRVLATGLSSSGGVSGDLVVARSASAGTIYFGSGTPIFIAGDQAITPTFRLMGSIGFWTDNTYDIGAPGANRARDIYAARSMGVGVGATGNPGMLSTQVLSLVSQVSGCSIYGGSGVPALAAADGSYYFRSDTPATANQRIYVHSAGAWVGIV